MEEESSDYIFKLYMLCFHFSAYPPFPTVIEAIRILREVGSKDRMK